MWIKPWYSSKGRVWTTICRKTNVTVWIKSHQKNATYMAQEVDDGVVLETGTYLKDAPLSDVPQDPVQRWRSLSIMDKRFPYFLALLCAGNGSSLISASLNYLLFNHLGWMYLQSGFRSVTLAASSTDVFLGFQVSHSVAIFTIELLMFACLMKTEWGFRCKRFAADLTMMV